MGQGVVIVAIAVSYLILDASQLVAPVPGFVRGVSIRTFLRLRVQQSVHR